MRSLSLASRSSQLRRPAILSISNSYRDRYFHSTRPSPFVAELITTSTDFLHAVHGISGLPWAASIPLTAVIVRTAIAFPLQIYARINARKRNDLSPLLYVHRKALEASIRDEHARNGTYLRPSEATTLLRKKLKQKENVFYKKWRITKYANFVPLLQIPVWLSLMEGIRNMCGVNLGLFRYLLPVPGSDGHAAILPGTEQSLATEGAFWFPDLLAADPTGALPILLGLTIIANVRSGWKTKSFAEASDYATGTMSRFIMLRVLKEGLSAVGIYIACTAYVTGMPAGMMLYWIASTNTATLQARFLDHFLFASKPLQALSPMYIKVLKAGEKPPPVKPLL